jgi:hypothetical protein
MSNYFKKINIPPIIFILALLLFMLIVFIINIFLNKTREGYSVISYADAPGNNLGILDVTDVSNNWIINTGQEIGGINYSGGNCRNVCDNLANCAGYLFTTNTETTGTCTFKSNVSNPIPNQNFNYYLNIKQ